MQTDHDEGGEGLRCWREWGNDRSTTFFQSLEWAENIAKHFPEFSPAPSAVGNCLIPLMRLHRWGWISDSLYGLPFMTPGGILSRSEMSLADWKRCIESLDRIRIGSLVIVFPFTTTIPPMLKERVVMESTHVVDLSGGWESVWKRYTQKGRTSTRKAELLGIEISKGKDNPHIQDHWTIVQAYETIWKPNPRPTPAFIEDLLRQPSARLYLASYQGEVMASVLVFFHPREVFFWQGARKPEGSPHGIVNLLYTEVLKDACQAGIPWANLGGSLGIVDLVRFKESFGARAFPVPIYKRKHPLIKWIGKGPMKRSP